LNILHELSCEQKAPDHADSTENTRDADFENIHAKVKADAY
jgi:hypothetical protein